MQTLSDELHDFQLSQSQTCCADIGKALIFERLSQTSFRESGRQCFGKRRLPPEYLTENKLEMLTLRLAQTETNTFFRTLSGSPPAKAFQ
jgi:hypothetical protein